MRVRCATIAAAVLLAAITVPRACAQPLPDAPRQDEAVTLFPHEGGRFWLSGQINVIFQAHGDFPALYSGPHSLQNRGEHATSRVLTLYTGVALGHATEFLFDVESAGGGGISQAFGLAGFTNLDVVRNPSLGSTPYIARIVLQHTFALSQATEEQERSPFALAKTVPRRRLLLRAGKFGVADFFDTNAVGSDSHLQFTNWTIDNNGAYDYAADTRGYSYGIMAEYHQPLVSVRFAEMLMPKVANGIDLEWNLRRAHSENLEVELGPSVRLHRAKVRLLSYWNTANMGSYREAIAAFESGADAVPNIEVHRHPGTLKYGFGFNGEQPLPHDLRAFARLGWSEGAHESFAYTEVNNTASLGLDLAGTHWHRKLDRVGSAFVSNGLSAEHAKYLRLGGLGFLLGDGTLRYGREQIWESYYTAHFWRGVFASAQAQFIANPGYNEDRGPVWVPGLRMHVDF